MSDFHHLNRPGDNQQQMQSQHHQQAYFLNLQQQQQQQRNQTMQLQHQQIPSSHNMSLQQNFMTPTQHHQQIQQKIRSPTPPHQVMLQQRQQAFQQQHGMIHGMHGIQQQNSPQQHFQSQQSPRSIIRPLSVTSPQQHQQLVSVTQQQILQQQHYTQQFARPNEVPMSTQAQFIQQSSSQFSAGNNIGGIQGQNLRQMLIPQQGSASPVFRHNIIQREQLPKTVCNTIRFPSRPATTTLSSIDKLSSHQDLNVLHQNYSSGQITHQQLPPYSTGNEQQQRFLQHQQQQIPPRTSVVHSNHQQSHQLQPYLSTNMGVGLNNHANVVSVVSSNDQLLAGNTGGGKAARVPLFVTSHNQQQQVYVVQQQQKQSNVIDNTECFVSPSFMNIQKNGTPVAAILLNEDGLGNSGRSSTNNQILMEQQSLNGSNGSGNYAFLHPKTDYLIGQHGSNSGEPSPSNNIEQIIQSESPGTSITFEGSSVSNNFIQSTSKKKTNSKQSLSKTCQQKNIANVGNSLGNTSNNLSTTKQTESNLCNDLIKASIPSQSIIKLLDREDLDIFVKSVDPNEVLEDEVSDALQLLLDDYVDEIIRNSVELCKHRSSSKLEARDIHFVLANQMKLVIDTETSGISSLLSNTSGTTVGGGTSTFFQQSSASKRTPLVAHQQRMALINKTIKKL